MTPLAFFGLGVGEMVVIGIVAVLLFGSRLPKVARGLGQGIMELRRSMKQLEHTDDDEDFCAKGRAHDGYGAHDAGARA